MVRILALRVFTWWRNPISLLYYERDRSLSHGNFHEERPLQEQDNRIAVLFSGRQLGREFPMASNFCSDGSCGILPYSKKNPCYYLGKVTLMVDLIKYRLEVVYYNNDYAIYQPQGTKTIFVNRDGLRIYTRLWQGRQIPLKEKIQGCFAIPY